jgi:multiple sugar transport system substrate-binding protein
MRILASTLIMALAGTTLVACGDDEPKSDSSQITVWSLEDVADRVNATKAIIADYTAKTGVKVNLVTVNEDQFPSLIASSAAAGDLPDVVGAVSLAGVRTLAGNDLLEPDANKRVVDKLGRDTFSPRALELTSEDGKQLAVPSDGWGQLLVYRKDLFAAAGLPAPDTYEKIAAPAASPASPRRPPPATSSPSRPSNTSRWPTTASSPTTPARSRWTPPSASRRSASTAT